MKECNLQEHSFEEALEHCTEQLSEELYRRTGHALQTSVVYPSTGSKAMNERETVSYTHLTLPTKRIV